MLQYILIVIFFICIFSVLLCCLTCVSCLGFTGIIKNIINKYASISHDRRFNSSEGNQPINAECFICLQRIKCQVVATCNHSYCAGCIIGYIQSKPNKAVDCPACRKMVCVLFRKFDPKNAEERDFKSKISKYNFAYSQQPSFLRSILEIGTFIRQLPRLMSREGLIFLIQNPQVKYILAMLIYTISPVDLLPQAILGPIGLVDDSVVLANIFQQFSTLMVNFMREENLRERNNQAERLEPN